MASTRARFTVSYVLLSMGAVVAFAITIWSARQVVGRDQLFAAGQAFADRLLTEIAAEKALGIPVTQVDSGVRQMSRLMRVYLDTKPEYFIIIGKNNDVLYNSMMIRMLAPTDGDSLLQYATRVQPNEAVSVPLVADTANQQVLWLRTRRASPELAQDFSRLVVGMPQGDIDLPGSFLTGTIIVMLPFILLLCIGAAYYMAGAVFKPMHDLTEQLEAIQDGRSLHRRLPPETENDELGRLTTTTNAMLSRLESSFAALRRFTADASHELKTPLAVLRADVERAMHPRTARDEKLVALEESLQEVTRMSDLVDSLLTLARADEGRFELAHEPVHIEPLLRDVFETATILGESNGLAISLPAVVDAVVMGERVRLRQLLLNLVTNAIKYTPRGGRVELSSAFKGPGEIAISVRDTGIGISATDLPHIFDRFWRADRARSRGAERSGFGLGLAISQYIAQAHGGSLTAQSRLGRGSLFTVILPTTSELSPAETDEGAQAVVVRGDTEPARP